MESKQLLTESPFVLSSVFTDLKGLSTTIGELRALYHDSVSNVISKVVLFVLYTQKQLKHLFERESSLCTTFNVVNSKLHLQNTMRRNAVWERILYSRFTRLKSFLHIHFQESPLHKRCQEVASAPNWFPAPKDWICWPENQFRLNCPSLSEFSQQFNIQFGSLNSKIEWGWPES